MFGAVNGFTSNELVYDLGDRGSITAGFLAKMPGPTMRLAPARLRFDYADSFTEEHELEAYERLIHDAMVGDHTLFTRADGIERLWEVAAPLLEDPPPVRSYHEGTWGPNQIHQLIAPAAWRLPFERTWRDPDDYEH